MTERFIRRVREVEARCEPYRWEWGEANREAITANWQKLQAEKPRVFNGRILLVSGYSFEGDTFHACFFEAGYADFLGWRDAGFPRTPVVNGFAMGALRGVDGSFVMGVMGAHTANAGRIYFPAGTPDLSDVRPDGRVDLAGSVLRELEEETGLAPGPEEVAQEWIVLHEGPKLAFLRPITMSEPADVLATRIRDHLSRDPDPELAGVQIVRDPADINETAMPDFLKTFLRWSFAGEPAQE